MATRNPVITGLGIVSAIGCGTGEVWRALKSGTSGLTPLSLFQSPRYGQIPVGEIHADLSKLGATSRGSRTDKLGLIAAKQALDSAGFATKLPGERAGVLLGCSVGGSFDSENFLETLLKRGKMRPAMTRYHDCGSTVDLVADALGLLGPSMAVATACSSGALAIATAAEMILAGEADVMLAGGADSISRMTWGGFHSLLLVDSAGCRPFDATRAGMTLGEGAGILVLESEESARARGAKIIARLSGWGASCDAHHATAPHPEGAGAAAAMIAALRRANLAASQINYVNAHGTGTRDNDQAEARAMRSVFPDGVPPFSSTKRFFGHTLAASGAIEAVVCVEALRRQAAPANLGCTTPDPAFGISPLQEFQSLELRHVMSNSFGFGGNNCVLIFSSPESVVETRLPEPAVADVVAVGVIGPGEIVRREVEPPLPHDVITVRSCGPLADAGTLTPNQRRRLSRLQQMALLAARRCGKPAPEQRVALAIGTGWGCMEDAGAFIENHIGKDEREPMPARFPNSVHNSAAGQVAIDFGARGFNSAPTTGAISFECGLWQVLHQLAIGEADVAFAGAVDEQNKYLLSIGRRWGAWTETNLPGEGAAVTELVPPGKSANPIARLTAVRLGRYRRPFDAVREAEWIASAVDLGRVGAVVSGAGGYPVLEPMYSALLDELDRRAGRTLERATYKDLCGEYQSASGFGFSVALNLVRVRNRGVLTITLALGGNKAVCLLEP